MKQTPYHKMDNLFPRTERIWIICLFFLCVPSLVTSASAAQAQDSTGIKRAFLDRYLDCAEAPDAAARLECFDALLLDIPAWLENPDDPPSSAITTRAETQPLDVTDSNDPAKH
jgi:hypothetical protein